MKPTKQIPPGMKFVLAGTAGMAGTIVVHPLDLVKTRMQISGVGGMAKEHKSSLHCLISVIRQEGLLAIYKGIGASLLRQATYGTTRLGMYTIMTDRYRSRYSREPKFVDHMAMGVFAGACGAFVGTPAEVALIRMTADGLLHPEQRRNYKNVFNALTRITREEGVATLWRGCVPTIGRAMVVNMAQLATYSQGKSQLGKIFGMQESIKLHLHAAILSGLVTTIASSPFDIAKTRIQNMKYIDGKPEYSDMNVVLRKIVKNEGVFALWKGFTPGFWRMTPRTVVMFVFLEKLSQVYYTHVLGTTSVSIL